MPLLVLSSLLALCCGGGALCGRCAPVAVVAVTVWIPMLLMLKVPLPNSGGPYAAALNVVEAGMHESGGER